MGAGYLRPGDVPGNIVCKESARLRGTEEPGHGLFLPICIGVAGPTNARTRATPPWKHVSPSVFEQNSCQSSLFLSDVYQC